MNLKGKATSIEVHCDSRFVCVLIGCDDYSAAKSLAGDLLEEAGKDAVGLVIDGRDVPTSTTLDPRDWRDRALRGV